MLAGFLVPPWLTTMQYCSVCTMCTISYNVYHVVPCLPHGIICAVLFCVYYIVPPVCSILFHICATLANHKRDPPTSTWWWSDDDDDDDNYTDFDDCDDDSDFWPEEKTSWSTATMAFIHDLLEGEMSETGWRRWRWWLCEARRVVREEG